VLDISEVYKGLRDKIFENRIINVAPRTVTNDLFLQPNALEISKQKILVSFTSYLQSFDGILQLLANPTFLDTVVEAFGSTLDNVNAVISLAVDNLAGNYLKTRKTATSATGIVSFYRPDAPATSELTSVIPTGTNVQSIIGMTYTTLSDIQYNQFYFDTTFNAFMIDVPVECTYAGIIGNAEQYTITTIKSTVPNWPSVTNKTVFTNGTDVETDTDFCYRCKTEISGSNTGTLNGIKNIILQNLPIIDVSVVGAGDEDMRRDLSWGGKVDVYITDSYAEQVTWTYYADGLSVTYIEGLRPIIPTAAVTVTADIGPTPVINSIVADIASPLEGSTISSDYIIWDVAPSAGATVTLTYFRNKYIEDTQDFIEQEEYDTGADVLVKQALPVPVDVIFDINVLSGYSKADIINAITVSVQDTLNTKRIGETLEQSDIIALAYTVTGVDRVVTPLTKFNKTSETGNVDVITTKRFEYLRPGTLRIG